uniref:Folate transporter 1 n=1 Tax=Anthurium amnicola TaxID=1678845 RepID=A0A1D1XGA8_9ARAE
MPSAMEEGQRSELGDLLPLVGGGRGGRSLWSRPLLAVLLLYSFSSQFLPIEPYLVPYLTSVKGFSNFQVTVDIYPCSVYAQLVFTLLMAPACFYLSHKLVISLGVLGMLATYIIIWVGNSLLSMQIMQVTYGFGMSARLVFSSYIFHLVAEEEYQSMTSLTTTASLLSFMLASELGQFLALQEVSYWTFFVITLSSLGICSVSSFLLPKDHSSSSVPSVTTYFQQNKGWIRILKETWHGRTLQFLSLWLVFFSFYSYNVCFISEQPETVSSGVHDQVHVTCITIALHY